jgi:hypothetical protein
VGYEFDTQSIRLRPQLGLGAVHSQYEECVEHMDDWENSPDLEDWIPSEDCSSGFLEEYGAWSPVLVPGAFAAYRISRLSFGASVQLPLAPFADPASGVVFGAGVGVDLTP